MHINLVWFFPEHILQKCGLDGDCQGIKVQTYGLAAWPGKRAETEKNVLCKAVYNV